MAPWGIAQLCRAALFRALIIAEEVVDPASPRCSSEVHDEKEKKE